MRIDKSFQDQLSNLLYKETKKGTFKYKIEDTFTPIKGAFAMWKTYVKTGKKELVVFDPNLVCIGGRLAMCRRIATDVGDTRRQDALSNPSPFRVTKFIFGDEGHEPGDITQGRTPVATQTKLFCTQDSGKCPIIMKATGDETIPAQYEILDLGPGIPQTQVKFWATVAAGEGNGTGAVIYSEAGLVTGFAPGTSMPGTRAYCEVEIANKLAVTAITAGSTQNSYTIELTDTVIQGNETVTWGASSLTIAIEAGVSTITDVLTAAVSPVGTPWAYLTDASGNPDTTTLNAHVSDPVSAYASYIPGTAAPHNYDGNRDFGDETNLKDYNPLFDLLVSIKTFGVQTKSSQVSFSFSWTLIF